STGAGRASQTPGTSRTLEHGSGSFGAVLPFGGGVRRARGAFRVGFFQPGELRLLGVHGLIRDAEPAAALPSCRFDAGHRSVPRPAAVYTTAAASSSGHSAITIAFVTMRRPVGTGSPWTSWCASSAACWAPSAKRIPTIRYAARATMVPVVIG